MKKILSILIICMFCLTGCTYDIVDTAYFFDYAYISLPNGEVVEGEVENWRDYEDGDQVQIKINGVTYLTDTTRAVLVQH